MFQWQKHKAVTVVGASILVCFGLVSLRYRETPILSDPPAIPDTLPSELSDEEFWKIIEVFSEPNGYFRSDNLLSNESGLQDVIPKVKERINPGGVYIGVGPEQNFTYVLAFQPKISFVVDIRRLNMLEHLLYKAIFELSKDRAEFISYLFSRPRPRGLTGSSSVRKLFDAYDDVEGDTSLLESNTSAILQHLLGTHEFALTDEDQAQIRYILSNFFQEGPDLSYTFLGSYYQGTLGMPTYKELMQNTDGEGHNWGFLATEEQFHKIQDIQRKNLLIPLVGDFAGPKTLHAVADYMSEHNALLSVFYTSNVEMYLFQQGNDWKQFYENVSALPFNSNSKFIRFAAGRGRRGSGGFFSMRSQMWSPVRDVIQAVRARRIDDYAGVLDISD